MTDRLENKIVIITGAAKGIGRGIAVAFAKVGATLVVVDVDREGMEETARLVKKQGSEVMIIEGNIRKTVDNNRLVDQVIEQYGRIDVLVNNAGITPSHGILETTHDEATVVFETNLIGPFFLTQRVLKSMVERKTKGSILFTSSTHGQVTIMLPTYSATKAAITMLVKELALEMAQSGIRVNAVAPGTIAVRGETDLTSKQVPAGKRGTPEDIGKAMVFLASDEASYITGHVLTVDGGFSLTHTAYWIKNGLLKP